MFCLGYFEVVHVGFTDTRDSEVVGEGRQSDVAAPQIRVSLVFRLQANLPLGRSHHKGSAPRWPCRPFPSALGIFSVSSL